MSAEDAIRREMMQAEGFVRDAFIGLAVAAKDSIQFGSPITGAPGQPVDTGYLRNSWQIGWDTVPQFPGTGEGATPDPAGLTPIEDTGDPMTATRALIATNVEYAEVIEDGVISLKGKSGDVGLSERGSLRRLALKSGGPGSVKQTAANMQLLANDLIDGLALDRAANAGRGDAA